MRGLQLSLNENPLDHKRIRQGTTRIGTEAAQCGAPHPEVPKSEDAQKAPGPACPTRAIAFLQGGEAPKPSRVQASELDHAVNCFFRFSGSGHLSAPCSTASRSCRPVHFPQSTGQLQKVQRACCRRWGH